MFTEVGNRSAQGSDLPERSLPESEAAVQRVEEILQEHSERIANAVHGEAGQLLAAVLRRLDEVGSEVSPGFRPDLAEIREMLEGIGAQLREITQDVRPAVLDDFGLFAAVGRLIEPISKRHGMKLVCEAPVSRPMAVEVETAVYRVVQECLNNAVKHSGAEQVRITFAYSGDQLECIVSDNGVGFDLHEVFSRRGARGMGMVGMRERIASVGGSLAVVSSPGGGCRTSICVPLGA